MKLFSITIIIATLCCSAAHAGDFAKRHIHGFSPNGGLFAFEEYGVQDGSGFPYSTIYVIDTNTDQWTANSPYRVRLDDESASVFQAREEARILAGLVMKSFEDRGNIVATKRPTDTTHSAKRMSANPRLVVPPIDREIEFRLEKLSFAASGNCEAFGESAGFKLTKIATDPSQTTRILHEDTNVPNSRNCPLDYDLADIVTYYPDNAQPKVAVLILVKKVGFEGPDGRYMAVTTNLD
jgi:predicted secreted protein